MCGICGEIRFDGKHADPRPVSVMNDILAPRGPDGAGIFAQGGVCFAHRRLKIIDLSDRSQQPMLDPELGLGGVFNGCIYNYRELRRELKLKGYRFFSDGDTEVVLKAFHAWGPACLERLSGMFALAIWERDSGTVTLARDRLGIKPLYFSERRNRLRFASTLPALVAAGDVDTAIDPVALNFYMNFHAVVPPPYTILKGVRKLPPATVLRLCPDGTRSERRYWSVPYADDAETRDRSDDEWQARILDALRTAVRRRLVADVPVGVLLSGGLDSSLIVGLLREEGQEGLDTFSVGFETVGNERGDEFQYSDIVANRFETNHHKIFVDSETRLLPSLDDCIGAMSEPMVSHDNIGFFLLSQEVSKHMRVVQSGQGADEVFGGYHWYPPLADSRDGAQDYARLFRDRDHDEFRAAVRPEFHNGDCAGEFIARRFADSMAPTPVDKALEMDTHVMLVDDPVKRVDNMTMAWGLEARVPFLDHDLIELASQAPYDLKIRDGGKYILKEAARAVIPSEVIDRPKGYFPVPALKYIRGPVRTHVETVLRSRRARERGLFNDEYVDMLLENPEAHITPLRGSKLWQIALLEMWMQVHGV